VLRLASYNVLADGYIDAQRYVHVPPALLRPETRHAALLRRIRGLDADVICLQEVEADVYALLGAALARDGYLGLYAPKLHRKPDGCAAFLRRASVELQQHDAVYFRDDAGPGGRSGHLALDLYLETASGPLRVIGTHLKWDADGRTRGHVGERQAEELLALGLGAGARAAPLVVCGDFNATPESRLVQRILAAGLGDAYAASPQATAVSNGSARRIDYVFHSTTLNAAPRALPPIDDAAMLPAAGEPSDHLPLAVDLDLRAG